MADLNSLPAYLLRNAKNMAAHPAIREKHFGIWETYSWKDYTAQVRDFALGLASMGFSKGDKLAVIGDNRPRLYWSQLAAQCLGGTAVPVYQDSIASELGFVLNNADVKVIVAEDQEQVDKILSIRDQLPTLSLLVYDDSRGLSEDVVEILHSFEWVQNAGREHAEKDPQFFEQSVANVQADDVALMCYTSGTTGNPKGVMLSHQNVIACAQTFVEHEQVRHDDDFLSYLPMAWIGDATFGLGVSLLSGCACNCPENPETLERDLRELGPTGLVAPPRAWESILSIIQVKAADASPLKRYCFEYFKNVALRAQTVREEGSALSAPLRLLSWIGEYLVYGPVRDQFGLRRARWCYTGGGPLGPDTFRFFRAIGVNLKQLYGATELTGLISLQPNDAANPDTVGPPCAGIEVKIADNGEVLVRSKGVFRGYYKNDEAYAQAIDGEGFFHTGDAGIVDAKGHLTIIDRAKDVGQLADGTPFAPQFVENKLKFSPYINEVVSFGDSRPFVCAMIAIDGNTVGNWAEKRGLPYTNYLDLSQKDEVRELIRDEISRINRSLPEVSQVKRFLLLAKDFDADDAEVTRTRKLRRNVIAQRYEPVIQALYGGEQTVELRTEVTFEDGRRSHIDTSLTIQDAA